MHMRISYRLPVWVFIKSKTENQLIRFVIVYLVADNNVKCETVAQPETPDIITPDLWPPNSPDLNPVDYRDMWSTAVTWTSERRKSVKNWTLMNWSCIWLKHGLASSKVSLIRQLTNGEFTLMHVSKPKESILKTCCDVLFHNCQ